MVRVEHVLESWKTIRQDTIAAVQDFPAGEFNFKVTPDLAAFGEIAGHILIAGDGLAGMLLAGEEDFSVPDFRERLKQHAPDLPAEAGPEVLVEALERSIERRTAELAARPPEFFAHMITRFDGQRLTRLEMVQFLKEHELTHRAQLFMCLRLKGITPATTRRRMARQGAR